MTAGEFAALILLLIILLATAVVFRFAYPAYWRSRQVSRRLDALEQDVKSRMQLSERTLNACNDLIDAARRQNYRK